MTTRDGAGAPLVVRGRYVGDNPESGLVCPVKGCDRRYGSLSLFLKHLTENWFGGHGLDVTWTITVEGRERCAR